MDENNLIKYRYYFCSSKRRKKKKKQEKRGRGEIMNTEFVFRRAWKCSLSARDSPRHYYHCFGIKIKMRVCETRAFFFFFCITKILKFPIGQIYLYRSKKLLAINENACKNLRILACPSIISLVSPAWNILCVWNINDLQRVGTFNER